MGGVLDTLAAATPLRRTVTMCIDGALQEQWDAANQALDDLGSDPDAAQQQGSLAMPALTEAVNRLEEIRDQVIASRVTFVFEAIDWSAYLTMQAAHPPRDGNLFDRYRGFNTTTFYRDLIPASAVSVTDAAGDTATEVPAATWQALLGVGDKRGSLNAGQVDKLIQASTAVNTGENTVPPSARSLLETQDSGASLARPGPGTSRPEGSTAGSRRTSPTSSTTKKKARSKAGSAAT